MDLDALVRQENARWRRLFGDLRVIADYAKRSPEAAASLLLSAIVEDRRLWRRYLRSRFGLTVVRGDLTRTRPTCIPTTFYDRAWQIRGMIRYVYFDMAWEAAEVGYASGGIVGLNDAILRAFESIPLTAGLRMDLMPLPHQRAAGTATLAGWVSTRVSGSSNQRLRRGLTDDGSPFFASLVRQLPATVRLAWEDYDWDQGLTGLVSATVRNLEAPTEPPRRVRQDEAERLLSGIPDVAAADFRLRDQAQRQARARARVDALAAKAKLSRREKQVLALVREERKDQEIAVLLGVSLNRVEKLKINMRRKLRQAAESA